MYTNIKRSLASKLLFFNLVILIAMGVLVTSVARAASQECSFTVKPVAVCQISFYKLLATPKKYNNKYISVIGYIAISNGRLAVYPTELSFKLSIEENSFSLHLPDNEMRKLAHYLNHHYVRIAGIFNFDIIADRPGIGYISKLADVHLVGPRLDVPQDHYLSSPPGGWNKGTKNNL